MPQTQLTAITQISRLAGKAILKIYEQPALREVVEKEDSSPLTLADRRSHECIVEGLKALEENYPILSEESRQSGSDSLFPYENRKDLSRFWLIDPLDGTKEFIKRNGEFTVNIALIENHRPVLGVVYVPVRDEMYFAAKGSGAFLEKDGRRQKLSAGVFDPAQKGMRVVCSRSHIDDDTLAFIEKLPEAKRVSVGSSLKFLIIARGDAEIYPRLAPTMEWDTAAAQIVLEEAGGSVLQWENGKPLRYNKESLLNPFFVAYGKRKA
ncbi:MAG TPA: 3'(2'),5'-bisphosphate nucleotidase [Phaeodactylibacter sp.]|nr:3'(2'),5'-bisphosphate nucleotidase [Phaeodactylibacter sp.]